LRVGGEKKKIFFVRGGVARWLVQYDREKKNMGVPHVQKKKTVPAALKTKNTRAGKNTLTSER